MSGRRMPQVRRDLLLAAVRSAGRISRADLSRRTGMARMTVDALVTDLLAAGLLAERQAVADGSRAGRPARSLTLGPAAGGVVGAVIGPEGVRVTAADLTGAVRAERHRVSGAADVLAGLIAECEAELGGRVWSTVLGLPGAAGDPIGAEMRQRLGRPVIVRSLGDLRLLGELGYGIASGHTDVCHLRIDSGITCGLLLGGVPYRGASGAAGRIGHVQMDEIGPLCHCGHRGCLETIAAVPAILTAVEETLGEPVGAGRAVELSHADAAVERILADAGRVIGRVVADLANTINPALFVLDGPLVEPDGPIVAAVRESLVRYAQPEVAAGTEVAVGLLGDRAGMLGALWAGLRATPVARGDRTLARSAGPSPSAAGFGASTGPPPPMQSAGPGDSAGPSSFVTRPGAALSPAARSVGTAGPGPAGSLGTREQAVRREIITEALRGRGPTARSDLVKITRLPRAAVAELLAGLCHDGIVEPCAPAESRSGRPSPHFRLVAPRVLALGMSLGGDGVRVRVADGTGSVRYDGFRPATLSTDARPMLREAAGLALELLDRHGDRAAPEIRAALSVPAPVHPATGQFGDRSVLTMFSGYSPGGEVSAVLGLPVRVANNAQLAALAECRRGGGRGVRDMLYLSADQYLGGGLVAGGRMYSGAIGYAGEVGHLTVREMGPFCGCGRRGCLRAFLTPQYFAALLDRRSDAGPPSEDRLLELAASGDRPIQRALLDAGRLIGRSVAPLVSVFDPAVVVVGGRFTEPGTFVVDGVRESLQRHCAPAVVAGLRVIPAALGPDAEVLGAIESLL
ncbi:ROK family protein [Actinoplanes sp. NPDC049802]|uniref:ROK family protein n=1 Tax=Actinoplanes sp. NPDC049802 TaxID=3154742 RepID=UPI0033C46834